MPKKKNKETQTVKPEITPQPPVLRTVANMPGPLRPDILLDLALQEPNRQELIDYAEVIQVLRDQKKFTFRGIAKWLNSHGVDTDHNGVYREYTRGMPEVEARDEGMIDDGMEREKHLLS